jgi:hypothetical protein
MLAGATSADNAVGGRVTGEQITLTVSPSGTDYEWSQAIPSSSTAARSALSVTTGASVTFTPDTAGVFTIVCVVDSTTTYVLRITVTSTAISQLAEAIRQTPKADATVPAPALGLMQYFSDEHQTFCAKNPLDLIIPLLIGKIGAALTNSDQTVAYAEGQIWVLPDSTLDANHTVTISMTGATAGRAFWIIRLDEEAFTFNVLNGNGGGTIYTGASATKYACKFASDGTDIALAEEWQLNG